MKYALLQEIVDTVLHGIVGAENIGLTGQQSVSTCGRFSIESPEGSTSTMYYA